MKNPVFTVIGVKCYECTGSVFNAKYSHNSEQCKMLMCSCEVLPPTLNIKLWICSYYWFEKLNVIVI
jgi:hypothetical protein